jgi:hypothetical protein
MKCKIKICLYILFFASSFLISKSTYAQESSPFAKLAQDYILRLNQELRETDESVPSPTQEPVVVNPEAIVKDAVTESIDTISKTIEEITIEKQRIITEIKDRVKRDIDDSIIEIRKENTQTPAYELQKVVDVERTKLFENIVNTIEKIQPATEDAQVQKIEQLQTEVDDSLQKIQESLEDESGLPINFERSKRDIRETLLKFQEVLEAKKNIIESRQGELVFKDTDQDGISDYDELYIYKTNPESPQTKEGEKTDGQKIQEGINPLSDTGEKIAYQDPRDDRESFVSSSYRVDKIQLIKEENKIVFEGSALPNTYITLYIFSTPIIVTVKTDAKGKWNYELKQELENGEHQIYVASVESSGKIIARSNPILFTKSAEAATIGIAGSIDNSVSTQNFLKDNFILISLATLIAIVILGMMFVGNHKTVASAVTELKNQVDSNK